MYVLKLGYLKYMKRWASDKVKNMQMLCTVEASIQEENKNHKHTDK